MTADLAAKFLEQGVIGACIVALAIVVWKLYRTQNKLQDTRVSEAKEVTDRILALSDEWVKSINDLTRMVEKHSENVVSLRNECRERTEGVAAMIRTMIEQFKAYAEELRRRGRED